MEKHKKELRGLAPLAALIVCVLAPSLWFFPSVTPWSDEASYVSTAYKIGATGRIAAATHLPEDIEAYGPDHKPVHMPGYAITLAAWLALFGEPGAALWLNRLAFVLAVAGLFQWVRASTKPPDRGPRSWISLAALLLLPLGLPYANTAMAESVTFLAAVLIFRVWSSPARHGLSLLALPATAVLGFLMRETLLLLPIAFVLADGRRLWREHRDGWRRASLALGAIIATAWVAGAAVCALAFVDRGHYPGFLHRLSLSGSLSDLVSLVLANVASNFRFATSWSQFPHDLLFSYAALLLLAGLSLSFARGEHRSPSRVATLFLLLTLGADLAFYDSTSWRAHRVLFAAEALIVAVLSARWMVSRGGAYRLAGLAILNAGLLVAVSRSFIASRSLVNPPHLLSSPPALRSIETVREGDWLFSDDDFQFLVENPRCELLWRVPEDRLRLEALVDEVRPRFVILKSALPLRHKGYRKAMSTPRSTLWLRPDTF